MISGALVVVISQFAVVRKARSTPELDAARAVVIEQASKMQSNQGAPRSRLLLPASERRTALAPPATTPALHVEPLESSTGKENLEGEPRIAGAEQIDASQPKLVKAVRGPEKTSEKADRHVAETAKHTTDFEAQGKKTQKQVAPKFRVETAPVNAGFGEPTERDLGEKFSWGVQKAFNSMDGPQPFFFVDSNTGTLMFGLGWQH